MKNNLKLSFNKGWKEMNGTEKYNAIVIVAALIAGAYTLGKWYSMACFWLASKITSRNNEDDDAEE